MTMAAVLCCAMISTVFTSCSKDDDDKNPVDNNKPVAAVMDVSLTVGDDMVGKLNLSVEYYDADGKVQTEPLTTNEWKKSIKANYGLKGAYDVLERELVSEIQKAKTEKEIADLKKAMNEADSVWKAHRAILINGLPKYEPYTEAIEAYEQTVKDNGTRRIVHPYCINSNITSH